VRCTGEKYPLRCTGEKIPLRCTGEKYPLRCTSEKILLCVLQPAIFKGTVACVFVVWGLFRESSPPWALIPTLKQFPVKRNSLKNHGIQQKQET